MKLLGLEHCIYTCFPGNLNSGNFSTSVTFDVGEMEACFRYSFVINNESVKSEQFQLMIVDITNSTEAKVGAETVVIIIVRKDSRMFGLF